MIGRCVLFQGPGYLWFCGAGPKSQCGECGGDLWDFLTSQRHDNNIIHRSLPLSLSPGTYVVYTSTHLTHVALVFRSRAPFPARERKKQRGDKE